MAEKKTPDVPPIPVPPVEAAPKVAKAPAKAPAAKKPAAAKPIPPLVDLAGGASAPAAAQPNPYAQSAPAAQPNPYAQGAPAQPQPYNYGPYVPQPPQGLSITSMILGIVGVLFALGGFGFLLNVGAVVTGHLATKRQPYAKPFWLTGIITGYVGLGISLIWGLFFILIFVLAASAGGGSLYGLYN